ncbi:MAG: MerR family DNA-binding protein [Reyranella sp.]|uniref:MerR family DNA-binding protein n=1 Tax=Reyranella sp. TaxID=1929291 RepID=UPI0027315BFD|nr:MerR family DNA-binding protein [Reyranella sp.]MDP1965788.1 MerR family DNA-binding protein [Reyranella sp.]MDP2377364.1 MerR family DNA-binding protein [Reyranella sp.]
MPRVYAIISATFLATIAATDIVLRAAGVTTLPEGADVLAGRAPALAARISLNASAADWTMIALAAVLAGYGFDLHRKFWRYYLFRLRHDVPLISRQCADGDADTQPASMITTADLAQRAGVDFSTIQSSVRHGLIAAPLWDPGGHALYHPDDAGRLAFVRRTRELGFSWEAVCELAMIRDGTTGSQQDVYRLVERQLADVRGRRAELTDAEVTLATLASRCPRQGPLSDCPILNALSRPA